MRSAGPALFSRFSASANVTDLQGGRWELVTNLQDAHVRHAVSDSQGAAARYDADAKGYRVRHYHGAAQATALRAAGRN